jgi:hypothetical protein
MPATLLIQDCYFCFNAIQKNISIELKKGHKKIAKTKIRRNIVDYFGT